MLGFFFFVFFDVMVDLLNIVDFVEQVQQTVPQHLVVIGSQLDHFTRDHLQSAGLEFDIRNEFFDRFLSIVEIGRVCVNTDETVFAADVSDVDILFQ